MSAPPERRLAPGAHRDPADPQLADGSPRPAPTGEAAVPQATAPPPPDAADSPMRAAVSVLTTLGPPLTIATALMFYFGWARSDVQARYMGLDVSLFGFSTQDYVL